MLHKVFILQFMCTVCVLVGVWRETGKHVVFVCVYCMVGMEPVGNFNITDRVGML